MGRGGARIGAGRPPSTTSLNEAVRLEAGAIRTLPKARPGAAPAWPLSKASAREMVVWRRLWKRPQAIVWDEQGSHDEVAMYVRTFVEAEQPDVAATRRTLLLQQMNSLMLTQASLLRAGYRISTNVAATSSASSAPSTKRRSVPSSRGRLRAVEDVGPEA